MDKPNTYNYYRINTHLQLRRDSTVAGTTNNTNLPIPTTDHSATNVEALPLDGWQSGQAVIIQRGFQITRELIYDYLVERRSGGITSEHSEQGITCLHRACSVSEVGYQ